MKIEIKKLFPDWVIKENSESITLWFSTNRGNYNRKSFTFSKEITIDESFAEALGMYVGDGDMHRREKRHLTYASKDLDIAEFILAFLRNRLNIQNKDLTIGIHYGLIPPAIQALSKRLKFDNFQPYFTTRNRYPTLHIQVNGSVFRIIFEKIMEIFLTSDFLNDVSLRRGFIRGLFAAEGCVAIKYQEQFIDHLSFCLSIKERNIVNMIAKILDLEEVDYKTRTRFEDNSIELTIQNWRNYLKCWQIRLFDRCERKKDKFLSIAKNSKVYGVTSQKDRNNLWHSFTQKELAGIIGSWQGNVCKMLQGKILFSLDQIRVLEQKGMPLTIEKLRIGCLTELPYSKETAELFT